jgi:hypothetical protein
MNFQLPDLHPMMPELAMTAFALIVMLDLLIEKEVVALMHSRCGINLINAFLSVRYDFWYNVHL